MSAYVHVRTRLGRFEEIEQDCMKMLDVIRKGKILARDNPRTLAIAGLLIRIYRDQGRFPEYEALQSEYPAAKEHSEVEETLFAALYSASPTQSKGPSRGKLW